MIVSINQIEAAVAKAALGSGWPHGLAEECGQAAAWLAARGLDGIGASLEAIRPGPFELNVEKTPKAFVFQAAQAARAGPSAFDLLAAEPGMKCIELRQTDQPLLIIGFAGIAAKAYGNIFRLVFADGGEAIVDGNTVTIAGNMPLPGAEVTIEPRAERQAASAFTPIDIEVTEDLWQAALAMAVRSYVPSSTSSRRSGAGAGLTDHD